MTHELWIDRAVNVYGHGSDGRGRGWAGLRQVAYVRTSREPVRGAGDTIVEDHHYLTSLASDHPQGSPDALLALARSHWEIENRLHHTKDRSLYEDADRTRPGAATMARLRSITVGLLRLIPGDSAPQKMIAVAAAPAIALRLLKRKRLPRLETRL